MRTLRNMVFTLLLAAFAMAPPFGAAQAKVHHKKYSTVRMATVRRTSLRSGTMIAPARTTRLRSRTYSTAPAYVPSTNPYDNGHANVINKVREKWSNVKRTTRYDNYRLSHG